MEKDLHEAAMTGVLYRTGAESGDGIVFGADKVEVVSDALGALRLKIGNDLKFTVDGWRALWVVDWPMFERDDEAGRWVSLHHPFTAPKPFDADALRADPGDRQSVGWGKSVSARVDLGCRRIIKKKHNMMKRM